MNLKGMSSEKLRRVAKEMLELATDLELEEPTYAVAIQNGIKDVSYHTPRFGQVRSYEGECAIKLENGSIWKAIGHHPTGCASSISKIGYIEFVKL